MDRAKRRHRLRGILARADRGGRHSVGDNMSKIHEVVDAIIAERDEAANRIAALEAQLAAAEARLAELTSEAMVRRMEQAIAAAWPGAFESHRIKALARDLLTRAGIVGGDAP